MIWAILVALGIPLWLCAIAALTIVFRNRSLRKRPGNLPVRVKREGKRRWVAGHAVWVSDVFVWRGSPAAWKEELLQVADISLHPAADDERRRLHRIGDDPVIASLALVGGGTVAAATRQEHSAKLLGPARRAT